MSKSNAIILAVAAFIVGIVAGLGIAAFKGTPPALKSAGITTPGTPPQMENVQRQMAELEKQIQENPGRIALYVQAGNLFFDNELWDKAASYYEKALELGGPNADVQTDAGICYRRLGDPKKAVEYFRKARKTDPRHENSALNLGIVLFHDLNDKKAALAAWEEYLALDPKGPEANTIRRAVEQLQEELKGK